MNKKCTMLVEENIGLAVSIAKKFFKFAKYKHVEKEDIIQFAMIGLMKATKKFDASRDSKFSTYAYYLIVGEINNGLRNDKFAIKFSSKDRKVTNFNYPISYDKPLTNDTNVCFSDTIRDNKNEYVNAELRILVNTLDPKQSKVIKLKFFKGLSQVQISKIMGTTQVQISRIERKALLKLREELAC